MSKLTERWRREGTGESGYKRRQRFRKNWKSNVRTRERDATSQEDYTERETRERGWRIARQRESRGRGGD